MNNKTLDFSVKKMVYISFFVAIAVVVNTLRFGIVSFGGFPIILSGYFMGPASGFMVGFLADIISFMLRPSGDFNILFAITSGLTGFIPVYLTIKMGDHYPNYKFAKVLISIAIGQIVTSVIMVPIILNVFLKMNFWQRFIKAAIKQAYSVPVYSVLFVTLNEDLKNVLNFSVFHERL